jgi:hypothetical protein
MAGIGDNDNEVFISAVSASTAMESADFGKADLCRQSQGLRQLGLP